MSQPSRMDSMLSRWQKMLATGKTVTPESLCRDCPELVGEVRPVIEALKKIEQVGAASRMGEMATLAPPGGDSSTPCAPAGFEIVRELGRGGMGVVYQAWQTNLGRNVALKMVLSGGHAGSQERARFRIESEAIARLGHSPTFCQFYLRQV